MRKHVLPFLLLLCFLSAMPLSAQEQDSTHTKLPPAQKGSFKRLNDTLLKQDNPTVEMNAVAEPKKEAEKAPETEPKRAPENLDSLVTALRSEIEILKAKNTELTVYKNTTEVLVKRQLSHMVTSVDQEWLRKTYSGTDMKALEQELSLYESFKDQDKGIDAAYKKLKSFYDNVKLYYRGVELVNGPYDAQQVTDVSNKFSGLSKNEKNPDRKKEVETILEQLKSYKSTLVYFQKDVIGEIDDRLESYKEDGTDKKAWTQIKSFLDTDEVEKFLIVIPWLGQQYYLYVEQLEKDPYAPNPARETILSIKP